jgi:hypothetical protein
MLDAGDDGEQAHEEEDGDPLDLGEHAVEAVRLLFRGAAEIVQQQQERRARQCDAAGLQADRAGQDEGEDDQADDEQGLAQQRPVGDGLARMEGHDARAGGLVDAQRAAPDEMVDQQLRRQDEEDDRRQIDDEIVERKAGGRTDDDVRGIADEGGGAADVGGEDLGEEEGVGRHPELLGDDKGYRRDEQDCGDVVEQGRDQGRHQREQGEDGPGPPLGRLGRPDRQILEHAAFAGDGDQQHHADEQRQRVEILASERLLLGEHAGEDHQAGADERDDGAVDPLGHDRGVRDDQQCGRYPQRIPAEPDAACGLPGHFLFAMAASASQ